MPILTLKLSVPVSDGEAATLAQTLTGLTAVILHKDPPLTAVTIESLPARTWFIGGEAVAGAAAKSFSLDIKITAGTNSDTEKASYIAAVFGAMADFLGRLDPASYVIIDEVPGSDWGYGGRTQAQRRLEWQALIAA